jgi:hypothetical protein
MELAQCLQCKKCFMSRSLLGKHMILLAPGPRPPASRPPGPRGPGAGCWAAGPRSSSFSPRCVGPRSRWRRCALGWRGTAGPRSPTCPPAGLPSACLNYFFTDLAGVGLLTTVEHHVTLEGARLCEGFATTLGRVGILAAMSQKVTHERVQHLWKTCQLCRQSVIVMLKRSTLTWQFFISGVQHLWKTCQLCRPSVMSCYKEALRLGNFS